MSENAQSQSRDQLILELSPLAHTISHNYPLPDGYTREDLVQEAIIGLIGAVDRFDSTRGATLQTWASNCIHNALRNCLRDNSHAVATVQIDLCEFSLPPTTDDTSAIDLKITLQASPISDRSRQILRWFLEDELSKAQIARELDCSRTHAGRLVKAALAELEAAIQAGKKPLSHS